jgi:hypothetical protein
MLMQRGMNLMLRTLSFASIAFTSILAGCAAEQPTTPGSDELAGENGQDGEVPKADGVDNFGFMAVTPTTCSGPQIWCSQFELARVNRSTTQCWGGGYAASCPVHSINWDALNLSASKVKTITDAIANKTGGTKVLVRGTFKNFVEFTALEPTEVWVAQRSGGSDNGTFVRIFDRGIKCITAPCPQFSEGRLNSTRTAVIDGIDFGNSAEDALQQRAYDATSKPDGVIVVGDRTDRNEVSFTEHMRSVNNVFLRVQ